MDVNVSIARPKSAWVTISLTLDTEELINLVANMGHTVSVDMKDHPRDPWAQPHYKVYDELSDALIAAGYSDALDAETHRIDRIRGVADPKPAS